MNDGPMIMAAKLRAKMSSIIDAATTLQFTWHSEGQHMNDFTGDFLAGYITEYTIQRHFPSARAPVKNLAYARGRIAARYEINDLRRMFS